MLPPASSPRHASVGLIQLSALRALADGLSGWGDEASVARVTIDGYALRGEIHYPGRGTLAVTISEALVDPCHDAFPPLGLDVRLLDRLLRCFEEQPGDIKALDVRWPRKGNSALVLEHAKAGLLGLLMLLIPVHLAV